MKRFGCLIAAGVAAIIVLILVLSVAGSYNSLVKKSQAVDNQWAQVETQLQRRFDLIPNLVNSVKGFFAQEQAIFNAITQARAKYAGAQASGNVGDISSASNELEGALGRLLVIVEDNPEIKSNTLVQGLMDELASTENQISVERRRYNDAVRGYNTVIKSFPMMFFAGMFGFNEKPYFESVPGANAPPTVEF
jgi:LemA protein